MSEQIVRTMVVKAKWEDVPSWRRISDVAPKQSDDASQQDWWKEHYELPLFISAKQLNPHETTLFTNRTNALRGLTTPINRPRCELQAACRTLQAVMRNGGSVENPIQKIEMNVCDSLYLVSNGTRQRLHTWYKNGYKGIANRDLWENIRLALDRLESAGIECQFVSSLVAEQYIPDLNGIFTDDDQCSASKKRKLND